MWKLRHGSAWGVHFPMFMRIVAVRTVACWHFITKWGWSSCIILYCPPSLRSYCMHPSGHGTWECHKEKASLVDGSNRYKPHSNTCSTRNPEDYFNIKEYHFILFQGVIHHYYRFIDVYIGGPGSVHDTCILANSYVSCCTDGVVWCTCSAYGTKVAVLANHSHIPFIFSSFLFFLSLRMSLIKSKYSCGKALSG